MIRVLIVDDHPFVRSSLIALFSGDDGINIVGECGDGTDVLAACADSQPDVVLMDLRMPKMSGMEASRQLTLRQPDVRVLILTVNITGELVAQAVAAGAVGFVLKGGDPTLLPSAIRTAADGGTVWPVGMSAS